LLYDRAKGKPKEVSESAGLVQQVCDAHAHTHIHTHIYTHILRLFIVLIIGVFSI